MKPLTNHLSLKSTSCLIFYVGLNRGVQLYQNGLDFRQREVYFRPRQPCACHGEHHFRSVFRHCCLDICRWHIVCFHAAPLFLHRRAVVASGILEEWRIVFFLARLHERSLSAVFCFYPSMIFRQCGRGLLQPNTITFLVPQV